MINEKNGRVRSVRTKAEIEKLLKKEIDALSPEEKEALDIFLKETEKQESEENLLTTITKMEYKRSLVDMRTFILDPYYLGESCSTTYPPLIADLEELFSGDYSEVILCLHPDTIVPLLNGTEKTIKQLAEEWQTKGSPFWIYSVTPDGTVVPSQAFYPRKTGEDFYYKVTLDDGTFFIANARHQMILRDGSKKMIKDMTIGSSLMPFETKLSNKNKGRRIEGYELILNIKDEKEVYTHALVANFMYGEINSKETCIHHVDINKLNNEPSNLQPVSWKEHAQIHARMKRYQFEKNPEYLNKLKQQAHARCSDPESDLRKAQLSYMKSKKGRKLAIKNLSKIKTRTKEEYRESAAKVLFEMWNGIGSVERREHASQRMRDRNLNGLAHKAGKLSWKNSSPESKEKRREVLIERNKKRERTDITIDNIVRAKNQGALTLKAVAVMLKCSVSKVRSVLRANNIKAHSIFSVSRNHCIASIELVGYGPVYCMTVPQTSNFAICTQNRDGTYSRNGVFSSNTGSIGWGKTHSASIGICRQLYELSCLNDPQKFFGLAPTTKISIVGISVNVQTAIKVVYENIVTKIQASPYFKENFPFEATKKEIKFPNNIEVLALANTDTSAIGMTIIGTLVDESSFMKTVGKGISQSSDVKDQAENLYNMLRRRIKSRFGGKGKNLAKIFIASSKNTTDDFTSRRIREAKNDPNVFVRDYASWDVKDPSSFSPEKFWVLCGNELVPSKIVDEPKEIELFKTDPPEGAIFLEVPVDFRPEFERNLEAAIRDLAGIATIAISPFIQRREKIQEAIDASREHPYTTMALDFSKKGKFMWDRMVSEQIERQYGTETRKLRPILNPNAYRHIHIDPSLTTDRTGFCMAHIAGKTKVSRKADDGREFVDIAPVYVVDLILQIIPPTGGEIVLSELNHLVYDLSAHGYNISYVSTDQFQGASLQQTLGAKGYTTERVSVDITPEPYDTLKLALYEGRILYYKYPPLIEELQKLEENRTARKRKIDHPLTGCFTGDTKVVLQDGSSVSISSLNGKTAYVVSALPDGTHVQGIATGRLTKYTKNLFIVSLQRGQDIICTPEHPFMLADGTYKQAKDLTPSDALMTKNVFSQGDCHIQYVGPVNVDKPVPVYDLEVSPNPNFLLSAGVFVHNSKDLADALAGCIFTLSLNQHVGGPVPILKSSGRTMDPMFQESPPQPPPSTSIIESTIVPPLIFGGGFGSDPDDGGWSPL